MGNIWDIGLIFNVYSNTLKWIDVFSLRRNNAPLVTGTLLICKLPNS